MRHCEALGGSQPTLGGRRAGMPRAPVLLGQELSQVDGAPSGLIQPRDPSPRRRGIRAEPWQDQWLDDPRPHAPGAHSVSGAGKRTQGIDQADDRLEAVFCRHGSLESCLSGDHADDAHGVSVRWRSQKPTDGRLPAATISARRSTPWGVSRQATTWASGCASRTARAACQQGMAQHFKRRGPRSAGSGRLTERPGPERDPRHCRKTIECETGITGPAPSGDRRQAPCQRFGLGPKGRHTIGFSHVSPCPGIGEVSPWRPPFLRPKDRTPGGSRRGRRSRKRQICLGPGSHQRSASSRKVGSSSGSGTAGVVITNASSAAEVDVRSRLL